MKSIAYLLSILCLMVFAGCSENENVPPQKEPAKGNWGVRYPAISFLPNGEPWYGPEYVSTEKIFELSYLNKYIHIPIVRPIERNGATGTIRQAEPTPEMEALGMVLELLEHHDPVLYFESDTVLWVYSGIYSAENKATRMRVTIDFTDGSVRSEGKFIARLVVPIENERYADFLFPYGEDGYATGSCSRYGNPPDGWYYSIDKFFERYHIEGH